MKTDSIPYSTPVAECVDLLPEGPVMGFSQGEPIVTPSSRAYYDIDEYDVE